jgi:hypothetical protein
LSPPFAIEENLLVRFEFLPCQNSRWRPHLGII